MPAMSVLEKIFVSYVKRCGYAGFSNRQQKLGLHALRWHPVKGFGCTKTFMHNTIQAESWKINLNSTIAQSLGIC